MKTAKELSEKVGVHHYTVMRWIKEGKVDAKKFGHQWRISDEEFDRIMREGINHKAG